MVKLMDRLKTAVRLHQEGKLDDAEPLYRAVLKDDPDNVDALYLMGTIQYQRGQHGSAGLFLRKATQKNPQHAEARNNLGLVLEAQGKFDEAASHFRRAVELQPRYADAHYNLGNMLRLTHQPEQSVGSYQRAIQLNPRWGDAHANLGLALRDLGRHEEARQHCVEATRLNAKSLSAHNSLGMILKEMGDYAGASDSFRRVIELDPANAAAHSNFGITLAHRHEFAAAERECRKAIELDPNLATAHNNLGMILFLARREPESIPHFEEACRLNPQFADAENNLASALFRMRDEQGAIEHYRRSIAIRPTFMSWKNLAVALDQSCQWEDARAAFLSAASFRQSDPLIELRSASICPTVFDSGSDIVKYKWALDAALDKAIEVNLSRTPDELFEIDLRPSFALQFLGGNDRPIREKFARSIENCFTNYERPSKRSGMPTVGFVSVTGHEYAFVRSIGGLLQHFNRELWRPLVVCSEVGLKKLLGMIDARHVDFFIVPENLQQMHQKLRESEIDLLYHWEIGTSATSYLLPFMRPTPLQCTSWGIQVTSGIQSIDYYLSSELIETSTAESNYTEKLVRLKTMLSYQTRMKLPETFLDREQLSLDANANIYLCAQQIGKFHPDFDPVLQAILERDPKGQLVITESKFEEENQRLQKRMRLTLGPLFAKVRFIPKLSGKEYASLLHQANVILDPLHFGGVNTTYDSISAHKVTVTLPTGFNKGRYTLGCYSRIGVLDGVVSSKDDYVERAVEIAMNEDLRRSIEAKIAERSDILFECRQSAIELEEWMIETIERHRQIN
ncbi:tetratricopeptide repeat protein [bacterium]|nr:tetratricopeptide repeat protein [bacterium]